MPGLYSGMLTPLKTGTLIPPPTSPAFAREQLAQSAGPPAPADSFVMRFGQTPGNGGSTFYGEDPLAIFETGQRAYYEAALSGDERRAENALRACRDASIGLTLLDSGVAMDFAQLEFYHAVLFGDEEDVGRALVALDASLPEASDAVSGVLVAFDALENEPQSVEQQLAGLGQDESSSDDLADLMLLSERLEDALSAGRMEHARDLVLQIMRREYNEMQDE